MVPSHLTRSQRDAEELSQPAQRPAPSRARAKIALLDPLVANQIAAGEVVERPSSVVKELVENALDAGATRVEIHLDDGGKARVEVRDDGHGIAADEAALAFARHATSKLHDADELSRIGSFGFRGEALASIASVARVHLETRLHGEEIGVAVDVEGATVVAERAVACAPGTRLLVRDLFFNVPARAAFLRTAATELGHVIRLVEHLALAKPELALLLTHNGRKVCDYEARADLAERAADVLGADVAERLYPIANDGPYRVSGLLSEPGFHRGSPSALALVVDGRPVRDRMLANAVIAAYGSALERGRHAVGVVHLGAPPGTVDVNVHPTKAEVRFASSRAVHAAIAQAVGAMLAAAPWTRAAPTRALGAGGSGGAGAGAGDARVAATSAAAARARPAPSAPDATTFGAAEAPNAQGWRLQGPRAWRSLAPVGRARVGAKAGDLGWASRDGEGPVGGRERSALPEQTGSRAGTEDGSGGAQGALFGHGQLAGLRYLGQAPAGALVLASEAQLVLVDPHALHEVVLAATLRRARASAPLPSSERLLAVLVALEPVEVSALAAAVALVAALGFRLAGAGERAVLVQAQPVILAASRVGEALRALARALADSPDATRDEAAIAAFACAAAVPAGAAVGTRWVEAQLQAAADLPLDRLRVHQMRVLRRLDAADVAALMRAP